MAGQGQQHSANAESETYREGFRNLWLVINAQAAVILGLACVLLYMIAEYKPEDGYYAVTAQYEMAADGTMQEKRMRMVGLAEPYINQQKLMLWAGQAATEVMTFGFSDVNEKFSESRKLFTVRGWDTFSAAFTASDLLKNVLNQRQVITAAPSGEPTMVSEGVKEGVYTWVIEVPLLLTVRAGDSKQTEMKKVRMWIIRMPTTEKPDGIGIDFWMSY